MKKALVLGGGGFIGSHMVEFLKEKDYYVVAVDLHQPEYLPNIADEFYELDLRVITNYDEFFTDDFDEVYQFAADMGGAGYVFTGENDANIMHNSALINLNTLEACVKHKPKAIFYSSSACVYPEYNQMDPDNPNCLEDSAYPAAPDSEYGWEKLFSERLYLSFMRNYGLNVHIARYHNIFGPFGSYNNGKEKAPAALCRKVVQAKEGGEIEIWGDGKQTRSFLYVGECLESTYRLINSDHHEPINIGSDEMISITGLADMIIDISGKKISKKYIPGPEGVRGRNSENTRIGEVLGWQPRMKLIDGIKKTYEWISSKY
jgi:nucleoside-diphosphate-sugar epimerase